MVAKSVMEIDVNDEKFVSFMEKFREYQAALGDLPEAWRGAAHGISDSTTETRKATAQADALTEAFNSGLVSLNAIAGRLGSINDHLEAAEKRQADLNKKASDGSGIFSKLKKDSKSLAGNIKEATASLLSWGGIVGIFTGVLGAGGLFGLGRLASATGARRFTALGLNSSIGAVDSAAINYQKALSNPVSTLGAIRDTQADLSKRWMFQAMGVSNPDQDPAKLLPDMIKNARDIYVRSGSTLQGAEAHGLTNFFSIDDLNRFKNMSDEEIDAMRRRADQDARLLNVTDQQARNWTDFNVQLDRSSQSIQKTFVVGLGPLTPSLEKLSDALSSAVSVVLQSPELGRWIDSLAGGIERFGNYLASPEFPDDVERFMNSLRDLGHAVMRVVDLFTGKISLSEFIRGKNPPDASGNSAQGASILSRSSILSNKTVRDPLTGKEYIPGSAGDPRVWKPLKMIEQATGVAPTEYDRYFDEAGKKYNIDPRWLKSIAAAESSWDPNAVSKAGAQGLMQVMPQNFRSGEKPFSPRDNIMAGARIFVDGLRWSEKNAGGDLNEALRYYNGGKNRGSMENVAYPNRVRQQYSAMYSSSSQPEKTDAVGYTAVAKNTQIANQLLQQLVDRGMREGGNGVTLYSAPGTSALMSSAQLGG